MRPRPRRLDPNTIVLLKQIGIGAVVISVVALLITGVWYGTRLSSLTITEVSASGGETIDATEVRQTVETALDGTYLGLIPRRFAWFYPEEEIYEKVSATPRIHAVEVARENGTKLSITYDEYVPHALWCQEEVTGNCVFLDESGYAFGASPQLTGGSFLRFITSGREAKVGEWLVGEEKYTDIHEFVRLLSERDWFVFQIEIDQVDDVFFHLVGGGELKVRLEEGPVKVVENLFVVLAAEEFSHLSPGNFQYIDLRYGDKVFVNEESLVPEGEGASSTIATTSESTLE